MLRTSSIVKSRKGSARPPGILPISERTWLGWVAAGLVEKPNKFDNGVSAWPLAAVIRIALDGIQRPAGHGRKMNPAAHGRKAQGGGAWIRPNCAPGSTGPSECRAGEGIAALP